VIALVAIIVMGAPQKLAVLPATVEGPYGSAQTTELFDVVSSAADFRQGLELVPYNALFVDGVETIATTVKNCGSDVPCIARVLRLAKIDLGLRVIANFALDPPLYTFTLIEADGRVAGETAAESEALRASTEKLLDERFPHGGRLVLEVSPLDAAVLISPDVPEGVIAPGKYRVEASKDGYAPKSIEVEVATETESKARLVLDPIPEEASIVESPWLWTGVGVAVLAVVAVVLIATNPFSNDPTEGRACITVPNGPCP
jgi:hypothetical protein